MWLVSQTFRAAWPLLAAVAALIGAPTLINYGSADFQSAVGWFGSDNVAVAVLGLAGLLGVLIVTLLALPPLILLMLSLFGWLPRVRRNARWLALPNLVLLRITRRIPTWAIYIGLLVIIVAIAAFLIHEQHPKLKQWDQPGESVQSWFNAFYRGLTLLAFGADWTLPASTPPFGLTTGPELGWELQAIRFVLPVVAIAGLFLTLIKGFGQRLQLGVMPRHGHTVLCGLGEAGMAYIAHLASLRAYLRHGPIVVIEQQGDTPNVAACRAMGIPVIVDDALSDSARALRTARVHRAERVIGLLRGDSANVQFVLRVQQTVVPGGNPNGWLANQWWARRVVRSVHAIKRKLADFANKWLARWIYRPLPRVIAQVNEPQLAHRLENYEKVAQYSRADVRFYNIHAIQAQQLLLRYPPERFADLFGQPAPHIAIYGFGRLGQQVFAEAIRLCQYLPGVPLRVTIVDRDAQKVGRVLEQEFPEIARRTPHAAQVAIVHDVIQVTVSPPALSDSVLWRTLNHRFAITQHVICFGDETSAVALGLALRDQLLERQGANAPIFVRTKRARGMAALLDSNSGQREIPDGLYPFATLEMALDPRALDNGWVEAVAQILHEYAYLRRDTAEGSVRPADKTWEQLDDLHRRGTRHAVLHTDAKLRALGLRRFPLPDRSIHWAPAENKQVFSGGEGLNRLGTALGEPLPALEHRRYIAARLADGWQQADERADPLRRHMVFVSYDELGIREQVNDRRMTRMLSAAVVGDRERAADLANGDPLRNAKRSVKRSLNRAFARLAGHQQRVRPERRIGVIGPIGLCTSGQLTLEGIEALQAGGAPVTQIDKWLAGPDPFAPGMSRHAALATRGVRLVTPLLHTLERAAAARLHDRLIQRESVVENPELFWTRRVEIEALLPLPYDFLRERAATVLLGVPEPGDVPAAQKKATEDAAEQAQEALWDLLGQPHVRYTEMPLLAANGLKLAVPPETHRTKPDGTREALPRHPNGCPDHETAARWYAQWRLTLAYLFHRCDEIVLLRTPKGVPDGLDEVAGWARDPSRIPDPVGWAATGLFPAPGASPTAPARARTGRPVVKELPDPR